MNLRVVIIFSLIVISCASIQAQQPLARVVVGGMITTLAAILIVVPVIASLGLVTSEAAQV